MRKGFKGINEFADSNPPLQSPNTVGSLLNDLSSLSSGTCIKKTDQDELYILDETIDSDGKTYVKVAIKTIDKGGVIKFEERIYHYVEPHQAWYYNSFEGIEKGLRAARIWEGENDSILGYCLRYARNHFELEETLTPPVEYIVKDRMPAEAPVEANLEVISSTELYNSPRGTTAIGSIYRGEIVRRISCIVYTYPNKFPVKILRPVKTYKKNNEGNTPSGPLLQPGTIVYLMTYTGEGTYLGWYNGEEAWWLEGYNIANLSDTKPQNPWGEYEGDTLSQNLSIEVWYKISKEDGTTGWTLVAHNGDFSQEPVRPYYGHKTLSNNNNNKPINNSENDSSKGKLLLFASILILLVIIGLNNNNSNSPTKQVASTSSQSKASPNNSKSNKSNVPIEPVAKQNVITGYDDTKPILNDDGLCELTVDNTRNNMPVYVRIWDVTNNVPVRAFYISQGDEFTAYNLAPGWYQVRYIELYDNDFPSTGAKSENFELEQINTYNGIQYSQMTLTLYKVRNGNTYTSSIPADQI